MSVNEFTTGELVEFKGSKKGIIVNIKRKATFDEIKNSIIDKLESSIGFFNGAKICSINCEYLSDIQIMMLKDDISSKFDVEFIEEYNKKEITKDLFEKYRKRYSPYGSVASMYLWEVSGGCLNDKMEK